MTNSLDNLFTITCGYCGAAAPVGRWISTTIGGALPRGHYQCPKCRAAFVRRQVELERGQGMAVRCVPVDSKL